MTLSFLFYVLMGVPILMLGAVTSALDEPAERQLPDQRMSLTDSLPGKTEKGFVTEKFIGTMVLSCQKRRLLMNNRFESGHYFIALIRAVLKGAPPPQPPEGLDWEALYRFAAFHKLANMACDGLGADQMPGTIPPQARALFQKAHRKALAWAAVQWLGLEEILAVFEQNGIDYLPVKGPAMQALYPRPEMRTMADLDLLMKPEQMERAGSLLKMLGYTPRHVGGNHDVYQKKPLLNVELHRALAQADAPWSAYLNAAWERAERIPGKQHGYRLSIEDTYLYLLMHMVKHYDLGGTGVRSFLDYYLYDQRYRKQMNEEYIQKWLERFQLETFEAQTHALAEHWFGQDSAVDWDPEMERYVFSSGAYGTIVNGTASALRKRKISSPVAGLMRTVFSPLEPMQRKYPILKQAPALLPLFWIVRGARTLKYRRPRIKQVFKSYWKASGREKELRSLYKRGGLYPSTSEEEKQNKGAPPRK